MRWAAILVLLLLACGAGDEAYLEAFPVDDYDVIEVPTVGKFYLDDNPAKVKTTLRSGKPWEPHVLRWLEHHIVEGSTALDVGAHIGSITVPMANLVGPEGHVYAFEPQRKIHRELVHNLRLNGLTNVTPLRLAVGSEPGVVEMNPVVEYDGQVKVGEGGDEVELRTIDSFGFSDVSLIKIDVEGYDFEVLKGATETIRVWRPALVVEITGEDTKKLLRASDYVLHANSGHDYLALPKEKAKDAPAADPERPTFPLNLPKFPDPERIRQLIERQKKGSAPLLPGTEDPDHEAKDGPPGQPAQP
jgi:FkbM family methyltransferase